MKTVRFFLFFLLLAGLAQAQTVVRLCQDDVDVYPWHMAAENGLSNIMLLQVAKNLGLTIQTESMPWKRCLATVQAGKTDGAIAASFTAERLETGAYPMRTATEPDRKMRMSDETYVLFILKKDRPAMFWDGKHLISNNLPFAVQPGYSITGHLRDKMGVAIDDSDKQPEQLLRKVLQKNVVAAALIAREGRRLLNDPRFAGKITWLEPPLQSRDAYLLFSHAFVQKNPALSKKIWAEIAKVRESATYQREMTRMMSAQ